MRAIGGFAAAQRVANLSRLIDEAPADWRPRIAQALNDPTFHVSLSSQPPDPPPPSADGPAAAIRDLVLQQLPDWPNRQVRVVVSGPAGAAPGQPLDSRPVASQMDGMSGMMGNMMGPDFGQLQFRFLAHARSGGQTQRRSMADLRDVAAAKRAGGFLAVHHRIGDHGPHRSRRIRMGGTKRHCAVGASGDRRRSLRSRCRGDAARRSRHERNADRRARVQSDAGAIATPDREPYADASGFVARFAHAFDVAAPAGGRGRRPRRARQDAGDDWRDGRE